MTRFIGYNNVADSDRGMANLYLTIGAKVVGLKKDYKLKSDETVYFSYKENGEWYVKARATVVAQLSDSKEPWNDGTTYSRWSLKDIYEFPPFELNAISTFAGQAQIGLMISQPTQLEGTQYEADINQLKTATDAIISSLHLHAR